MTLASRVALIAFVLSPGLALGQSRSAISLSAGPIFPLGDFRDTQGTGTGVMLAIARGSDESPFGLRFSGSYDRLSGKSSGGVSGPDRRIFSGSTEAVFSVPGFTIKPYLTAGGGAYKMISRPAVPNAKIRFGFDFGLGFTFPLGEKALSLEGRLASITQPDAKPVRYFPLTLGILF